MRVAGAACAFGFNILLGRLFGPEGVGVYFLVLSVASIAAAVGRFGLENTLLRFISAYAAKDQWGHVKEIYRKGILLSFLFSALATTAVFLSAPLLSKRLFHDPALITPLRLMSLSVVPMALLLLHVEALKGIHQIAVSQVLHGVFVPLGTGILVLAAGSEVGIKGVIALSVFSTTAAVTAGAWLWKRKTAHGRFARPEPIPSRHLLESALPLFGVTLISMLMHWVPIVCLGIWRNSYDVGVFGVALRTSVLSNFVLISVNAVLAPTFAGLYSKGDMMALSTVARKSALWTTLITSPLLFLFVFHPSWVMEIFGAEFSAHGRPLAILAIGQLVNVSTGSVGYLLMMTGRERQLSVNTVLVGGVTICLNLLLVPYFGATGAAAATAAGMGLLNLGAFYLVQRELGIWTFPFYRPSRFRLEC